MVGLLSQRLAPIKPWMERYVADGKLPGALVAIACRTVYCDMAAPNVDRTRLSIRLGRTQAKAVGEVAEAFLLGPRALPGGTLSGLAFDDLGSWCGSL
jgi:hypothetical protein